MFLKSRFCKKKLSFRAKVPPDIFTEYAETYLSKNNFFTVDVKNVENQKEK